MASVNPSFDDSPDLIPLRALIAANMVEQAKKHDKEDPKAALAQLAKTMEEVLASVAPAAEKSGAPANPSSPRAPSNAQMQKEIGQLMSELTGLLGEIARYGQKNAQANAGIGQALMTEMQAQVQKANEEIQNIIKNEESQNTWSTITKVAEIVVGAIIAAIAIALGQPELAVIVIIFTILAVSGAMEKITDGLADVISKALVNNGVPKKEADTIAKVIAAAVIILASIVITLVTCGAGAGAAAETVADAVGTAAEEAGGEAAEVLGDAAVDGEGSAAQAAESTESFTQKLQNFFSKAADWIKENNPFSKLPKNVNLAILAGSQAIGGTNFGHDFMAAVLLHMKDKKTKEELEAIFGTIINLLAAFAGAGAGASACVAESGTSAMASWIRNLETLKYGGTALQVFGQAGSAVTSGELAVMIAQQGQTQAALTEIQSLVSMNSQQSSADAKALNAKMKTWATDIATFSHDINSLGEAVAHELQA